MMINGFLQILCNFYIVAIAALLPLYIRGTYVMLGDDKYILFRSSSLFCLGLGLAAALAKFPAGMREGTDSFDNRILHKRGQVPRVWESLKALLKKNPLSPVDVCVMLYGIAVAISALCSSYGEIAWTGYRDWHMGAVSQLIFVGIYFFVSRCYQGDDWPVLLLEAAFFLVILLGFGSRLGLDPLGLMREYNWFDWEYSHLISTIGNINWFCGYCAVALAMPVAGYLTGSHLKKTVSLYIVSALGLVLLCVQGSDIGFVLAAVSLGVCLLWSCGRVTEFGRTLLLTSGVAFGLPCYGWLVRLLGDRALHSQPVDGFGLQLSDWSGWWLIGMMCLGLWVFLRKLAGMPVLRRQGSQIMVRGTDDRSRVPLPRHMTLVRGLWQGVVFFGVVVLVAGGVLYLRGMRGSWSWTNGRGVLWRLSVQGFFRGDWKQRLIGAGPDCFAEYIYSIFVPSELFVEEGYWANAVFANAHNQWLNHLVNTGLLGTFCAVGVATAAVRRYRRYLPGVLVLALYGVNSMVSFQQVLSTPLFFVMLGICEYNCRKPECVKR